MSNDFHLRCATCHPSSDSEHGVGFDMNWQGDQLLALVPQMPLFAAVGGAGYDIDPESLNLCGSSALKGLAAWALAHRGHVFEVWSEYGDRWTGEADYARQRGL